jgi:hypothetical protein
MRKMMDADGKIIEISPEMLDAAQSIMLRIEHGAFTDRLDYLAVYLEKLAIKRDRRLRRNEERRIARKLWRHTK